MITFLKWLVHLWCVYLFMFCSRLFQGVEMEDEEGFGSDEDD